MKRLLILFAAAVLSFDACEVIEDMLVDVELTNRVTELEGRVTELENLCADLNANIEAIQAIVTALQNRDFITGVSDVMRGGKRVGYTITFSKGAPITIYHGADGVDGQDGTPGVDGTDGKDGVDGRDGVDGTDGRDGHTPVIGVRKDADGIYYWTLDGKWLLDDLGRKIKAEGRDGKDGADGEDGKDGADGQDGQDGAPGVDGEDGTDGVDGVDGENGSTPTLKIENGYWYVSYNKGVSWVQLGKATGEDGADGEDGEDGEDGDSMFREIRQDDANVYFVLADGTEIILPKSSPLSISFNSADLVVMNPNSSRNIGYTVASPAAEVKVEVVSSADIKARVVAAGDKTGYIQVNTSAVIDEYSKVVVFVSDGTQVVMHTLMFEEEEIEVSRGNEVEASGDGGNVTLYYNSNTECEVIIPDGVDWIRIARTKAVEEKSVNLIVDPNTSGEPRSAVVTLRTDNGTVLNYTIEQDAADVPEEPKDQHQIEREALIAIYNALDGPNWGYQGNWATDLPVNEWEGIQTNENGDVIELRMWLAYGGAVPNDIYKLKNLEILSLSNVTIEITDEIANLSKLKEFTAFASGEVSSELFSLSNIELICLSNGFGQQYTLDLPNPVNESNLKSLFVYDVILNNASNLGEYTNLETLGLGPQNNIPIPEEIGQLKKLKTLNAFGAKFQGSIPPEIGLCSSLKYLNLENSHLSGELPQELGDLSLVYVNVSHNDLSGSIPESIKDKPCWKYSWADIIYDNNFFVTYEDLPDAPEFNFIDVNGDSISSDDLYKNNEYVILYKYIGNIRDYGDDAVSNYLNPAFYEKYHSLGVEVLGISYGNEGIQYNDSWPTIEMAPAGIEYYIDNHNYFYYEYIKDNPSDINYVSESYPGHMSPNIMVIDCSNKRIIFSDLFEHPLVMVDFFENKYFPAGGDEPVEDVVDGEVIVLQEATAPGITKGIDIVLMGDGYTEELIADGTYEQVMRDAMEYLFVEEPYKTYRDHFNVYMVNAVSRTEGIGNGSTAFNTFFGGGTYVGGDDDTVFGYATNAISEERINEAMMVVMMNSTEYAGTCWMYVMGYPGDYGTGPSISYFPVGSDSEMFRQVLNHEANGHGFAKLDDEYAYYDFGAIPEEEIENYRFFEQYGWWKNTDLTDDRTEVKWAHFLTDDRYSGEGLGVYEGGSTYWSGVWRSTETSIMVYNVGGFNAPSREAIYYRIHKLAYGLDWVYDYEDFVEYDAVNRTAEAQARRENQVSKMNFSSFEPLAPPVVVRKDWREAMND